MQKKSFNQVFKRYKVLKKLTKKNPVVFDVELARDKLLLKW